MRVPLCSDCWFHQQSSACHAMHTSLQLKSSSLHCQRDQQSNCKRIDNSFAVTNYMPDFNLVGTLPEP
eukprot:3591027-Amphidinium_carterae.1